MFTRLINGVHWLVVKVWDFRHYHVKQPRSRQYIVACLGDSLTDGFPVYSSRLGHGVNPHSCYQHWLNGLIAENHLDASVHFINSGFCGDTTAGMAERLQEDIFNVATERFGRMPDVVIIVGGSNDVWRCIPPDKTAANLMAMHRTCASVGVTSVAATIPPMGFKGEPELQSRMKNVNEALGKFCMENAVPIADLAVGLGESDGTCLLDPLYDYGDKVHFSVAGYRRMAEILFESALKDVIRNGLAAHHSDSSR